MSKKIQACNIALWLRVGVHMRKLQMALKLDYDWNVCKAQHLTPSTYVIYGSPLLRAPLNSNSDPTVIKAYCKLCGRTSRLYALITLKHPYYAIDKKQCWKQSWLAKPVTCDKSNHWSFSQKRRHQTNSQKRNWVHVQVTVNMSTTQLSDKLAKVTILSLLYKRVTICLMIVLCDQQTTFWNVFLHAIDENFTTNCSFIIHDTYPTLHDSNWNYAAVPLPASTDAAVSFFSILKRILCTLWKRASANILQKVSKLRIWRPWSSI